MAKFGEEVRKETVAGNIKIISDYALTRMESLSGDGSYIIVDLLTDRIQYHEGVCDHHSAIFTTLCNHMGIQAGKAAGKVTGNPHAWSWVKLDGKKYFYDPALSVNYYYRNKRISWGFYKLSKSKMTPRYKFNEVW